MKSVLETKNLVKSYGKKDSLFVALDDINFDIKAGESKTITFKLNLKDLAFVNTDNKRVLEAGDFKIQVSGLNTIFNINKTMTY